MEYCPIVGNTLHRDTAYRRKKITDTESEWGGQPFLHLHLISNFFTSSGSSTPFLFNFFTSSGSPTPFLFNFFTSSGSYSPFLSYLFTSSGSSTPYIFLYLLGELHQQIVTGIKELYNRNHRGNNFSVNFSK